MRANSLIPILAILLVGICAWWLVRARGEDPGVRGPGIEPGIYAPAKREKHRVQPAQVLQPSFTMVRPPAPARPATQVDPPWRVVLIDAADHDLSTRVAVLGLAEELHLRGCIAVISSRDAKPFPLGADRVVRVRTLKEDTAPRLPGERFTCSLRLESIVPRLPGGHPDADLQQTTGHSDTLDLTCEFLGVAPGTRWPQWWAGVGQALAREALLQLAPSGISGARTPVSAWEDSLGRLRDPVGSDALRWTAAFQDDLVRGWIGRIDGRTTTTRNGSPEPAVAELERRLADRKTWEPLPTNGPWRTWRRSTGPEQDAGPPWTVSVRETTAGWEVNQWQPRPHPAALIQTWITAARSGDAIARASLDRVKDIPRVPDDLRQAIAAALARPAP